MRLQLNHKNNSKKIGVIKDFDNQPNAKEEHQKYDTNHENIIVRTTQKYTLEDDFVATDNNLNVLNKFFNKNFNQEEMSKFLKSKKANYILEICDALLREKDQINLSLPSHIDEVIKEILC